jgi:hypothetical protein
MANKACPNPKSKEWRNITKKVGVFEAFRIFIRNGYDVPTFVFKDIKDVYKYLDFNASRNNILSKKDNKYFIPYGKDLGTWYVNNNLVKDEVNRINNIYNDLLIIKSKPITNPDPRTPGRTKIEWVEVNEYALNKHYDVYNKYKEKAEIESGEVDIPIETYEQRVDYTLKLIPALQKIQRNKFDIQKLQGWLNDLQKQGIPKEQLDLFKESAKDGMTKDEILTNILSNYSYTVEVNIAKQSLGKDVEYQYSIGKLDDGFGNITYGVYSPDNIMVAEYSIEKEAEDYLKDIASKPAQYYSNLTVPGGINYTENEIKTPDIIPNIKGHAQFSTYQGIGWFRSDEAMDKPLSFDMYEDGILKGLTTRRILEIQSDLFQKGRDKANLNGKVFEFPNSEFNKYNYNGYDYFTSTLVGTGETKYKKRKPGTYDNIELTREEYEKETGQKLPIDNRKQENQFLQLLNKNNNWVTFFIKSIIQDSAKKGYEKVLFPKGETAAKVEGHETLANDIKSLDILINNLEKLDLYDFEGVQRVVINSYRGGLGVTAEFQKEIQLDDNRDIVLNKVKNKKQEFKAQGIEKLKPIEGFYEIKVGNILKKLDPNISTITDEYNNQWYEYTIKPEDNNKLIELQRKQTQDKLSPENRVDFNKKKSIMLSTFPMVKEVIEDYDIDLAGSLEAQGTIIRVNPRYYTTDTIGHEFGHLLIDLIGGTNNPLIKKGIEQLKESKTWESVLKRYPDLYETNLDKFHKEVLAQAIGEETANIFDKQKNMSDFSRWLDRLFAKIKQVLGIETNVAKKLARKVLLGKELNIDTSISESYESRVSDEIKERLTADKGPKSKIENLRNKVIEVLEKKEAIYKQRDIQNKRDLISNTLEKIKKLDDDPKESLKLFQDFAIAETERIYKNYRDQERKKRLYNSKFDLRQLAKWKDYLLGFSLLSEFIDIAKDYESDIDESFLNINKLNKAINRRKTIENAYTKEGIELVAEALTSYSSHIEVEFKEKFEREYNNLTEQEKIEQTKEEYIQNKLQVNADDIKQLTTVNIKAELLKASKDINQLSRYIDNVLDSPDVVVSAMAKMFVEAEFKARQEYVEVQDNMITLVRNLEDYYKSNNILPNDVKKIYDFMLEKDINGNYTQNIVDVYRSSLWDSYEKFKEKLSKEDISYDEQLLRLRLWKKENMPLDYYNFNIVKENYWGKLLKENLITRDEYVNLIHNDRLEVENKKDVSEIVHNDKAVELIVQFYRDNLPKYRLPKTIWKNPQWLNLVKIAGGDTNDTIVNQRKAVIENITKDPRIAFYNYIVGKNSTIQKGIPYGHRLHTRLPSILKSSEERLLSKENNIKDVFSHTIKSNLNVLADETERGTRILTDETGNPVHFIPIYYTASIRKIYADKYDKLSEEEKSKITKEDYINQKADENQSYDLASIYARYFNSAIEYKHKADILPVMETARELVNQRDVIQRDGKGNIVMQAISKGKEKALTKLGVKSSVAAQLNDWFEALIYGEKEKNEGNIFGGKVDLAKTINFLNKTTALNLLGLNFVQGTANTILGSTMQWIEAAGGQFYTKKDYLKAKYIYSKNLPGILGDIGARKPSNIVNLLLEKFDVLNEYDNAEYRKNSKFKKLLTTNTLFFTSHAGEHLMQSKVLIAMLNNLKAKDSNGKELGNMIDFFSVQNNKLILDSKVANFSKKEQALFDAKVRRVLSSMHGEYTSAGRVAIQRYALGRMAYMFRKFIVPGIKRRWGSKNINNLLGEYTEGYYITTAKFTARLFKDLKGFQFALMSTDYKSLTTTEKANIRKTITELSFMLGTILLSSILINMKEDADDDEDWYLSFLAYQAFRMKTELWFFSNPSEAMKILRSPAASMSIIENMIKLISQLMPPNFTGFDVYERGNWKGRPKIEKTLINFAPGLKQIYRLKYVDDQIGWLKN